MERRTALITGITGQDGAWLAKQLLEKGYKVYGTVRRTSTPNLWRLQWLGIADKVEYIHQVDITDPVNVDELIRAVKPNELYHLASQSHVGTSFSQPVSTFITNTLSTLYILDAVRRHSPQTRVYFAGTSEMFGNVYDYLKLNEETPMRPDSPYAVSKLSAYHLVRLYRQAYKIFAVTGILFNHESEIRGLDFVTRKISNAVAMIYFGLTDTLTLGNLKAERDWGYAPEYTEAMWLMLQQEEPDDYVIATGESHSVREFVEEAFRHVGLNWRDYVKTDEKLYRPIDVNILVGDYSKAEKKLGWKPRTRFNELVKIMVDADIERWRKWLRGEPVPFDAPYVIEWKRS
ncbi:putative GDP-mannose 4,6-dehydratase [Sulfolobales Beppu filamentous virus 2]|uniref:GDP-mannose 4,6-dehydratase n=1 Tax=Sulfolobales Beppu filamentous virus 2 TaxID=2493123 RepID=A0A3Q8Q3R3_9VIRU|nr:nucleotide-sugar epimerase [Sulfolobales Beppu filamentous virus 2]AZI75779.1 putative GDP-mannose 4,6-dehydratase [Sulfolobales Beppu filamentous virus 2]